MQEEAHARNQFWENEVMEALGFTDPLLQKRELNGQVTTFVITDPLEIQLKNEGIDSTPSKADTEVPRDVSRTHRENEAQYRDRARQYHEEMHASTYALEPKDVKREQEVREPGMAPHAILLATLSAYQPTKSYTKIADVEAAVDAEWNGFAKQWETKRRMQELEEREEEGAISSAVPMSQRGRYRREQKRGYSGGQSHRRVRKQYKRALAQSHNAEDGVEVIGPAIPVTVESNGKGTPGRYDLQYLVVATNTSRPQRNYHNGQNGAGNGKSPVRYALRVPLLVGPGGESHAPKNYNK